MEVRALNAAGAVAGGVHLLTRHCLVEVGMVLLLLPAVAVLTRTHLVAALVVLSNEGLLLPVRAQDVGVVPKYSWVPAEVLVVVGVWAVGLVVLTVERAPLGFVVKHEEVGVSIHHVNQADFQFAVAVRERAVVSVLALVNALRELAAVLGFVLLRMVHALNAVVRKLALGSALAITRFAEITQVESVESLKIEGKHNRVVQRPPLVLGRVEVATVLMVVLLITLLLLAGQDLEADEVEVLDFGYQLLAVGGFFTVISNRLRVSRKNSAEVRGLVVQENPLLFRLRRPLLGCYGRA